MTYLTSKITSTPHRHTNNHQFKKKRITNIITISWLGTPRGKGDPPPQWAPHWHPHRHIDNHHITLTQVHIINQSIDSRGNNNPTPPSISKQFTEFTESLNNKERKKEHWIRKKRLAFQNASCSSGTWSIKRIGIKIQFISIYEIKRESNLNDFEQEQFNF